MDLKEEIEMVREQWLYCDQLRPPDRVIDIQQERDRCYTLIQQMNISIMAYGEDCAEVQQIVAELIPRLNKLQNEITISLLKKGLKKNE